MLTTWGNGHIALTFDDGPTAFSMDIIMRVPTCSEFGNTHDLETTCDTDTHRVEKVKAIHALWVLCWLDRVVRVPNGNVVTAKTWKDV